VQGDPKMAIKISIPTALRNFTDGKSEIEVVGKNVGELVNDFALKYPDIKTHLFDTDGSLRSFINLYIGENNIKDLQGLDTPVSDGMNLLLVPAIAGGCR
jgi:molybdopterin converting factor small subunit